MITVQSYRIMEDVGRGPITSVRQCHLCLIGLDPSTKLDLVLPVILSFSHVTFEVLAAEGPYMSSKGPAIDMTM